MSSRGIWNNVERAKQLNSFRGLEHDNTLATDIDGLIEWKNKGYIFIEVKYYNKEMPLGQRLAYERLVDNLRKPAIAIVARHTVENTDEDVIVADCLVDELFFNGEKDGWREPRKKKGRAPTVKELVDDFLYMIDISRKF